MLFMGFRPLCSHLRLSASFSQSLSSGIQAAGDLAASSVFFVTVSPFLASVGVGPEYIILAPAQPLVLLAPAAAGLKIFCPLSRPALGTQFEHRGVQDCPCRPRCSKRFGWRGCSQCSPHARQRTIIVSRRRRELRSLVVPCSAADSLVCSQEQPCPYLGCAHGSSSAVFHLSGSLAILYRVEINFHKNAPASSHDRWIS